MFFFPILFALAIVISISNGVECLNLVEKLIVAPLLSFGSSATKLMIIYHSIMELSTPFLV